MKLSNKKIYGTLPDKDISNIYKKYFIGSEGIYDYYLVLGGDKPYIRIYFSGISVMNYYWYWLEEIPNKYPKKEIIKKANKMLMLL
jgi:hypothetical protein